MSSDMEKEAEAFRKWFASQTIYNSVSAMERALNIPKHYLQWIKAGSRRASDPERRRKIREATGLSIFDPLPITSALGSEIISCDSTNQNGRRFSEDHSETRESKVEKPTVEKRKPFEHQIDTELLTKEVKHLREKVDLIHTKLTEAGVYQEIAGKPSANNAEARSRTVMRLLMSLASELEFFKSCTENERKIFKKIVPGQDVGYITTLLRALYDEDKFQKWLLFSTYTMKGKENGE